MLESARFKQQYFNDFKLPDKNKAQEYFTYKTHAERFTLLYANQAGYMSVKVKRVERAQYVSKVPNGPARINITQWPTA